MTGALFMHIVQLRRDVKKKRRSAGVEAFKIGHDADLTAWA